MPGVEQAEQLRETREREHPDCLFCNAAENLGLKLRWFEDGGGEISVEFCCDRCFQSYPGVVHGGLVSLLFDGLMTNRLFAEGVAAVTGELKVRYLGPVPIDRGLRMTARIVKRRAPLYVVEADLKHGDEVLVRATGKFMEKPVAGGTERHFHR